MEKKELVKAFENAVLDMVKQKEGCYFWWLDSDNEGRQWAIVLGWSSGFDPDENDRCSDGEWHLCAKVAYNDSFLQCDYGIDWMMPINEEGDVWDTDVSIYLTDNHEITIDWLLKKFEEMKIVLPCWKEEE